MKKHTKVSMQSFTTGIIVAICLAAFVTTAASAAETQPKKTWYDISGTLYFEKDKPTIEGFVLLKDNAGLCTITDGEGKFVLKGWAETDDDVLIASYHGCVQAEIPLKEYLKDGKVRAADLKIVLEDQDPEYSKLEVGAAITTLDRGMWAVVRGTRAEFPRTPKEQECVTAWHEFMKAGGRDAKVKIILGEPLSEKYRPYKYLLHLEISSRARVWDMKLRDGEDRVATAYCKELQKKAESILKKKVYKSTRYTAEELDVVRMYIAARSHHGYFRFSPIDPSSREIATRFVGNKVDTERVIMLPFERAVKRVGVSNFPSTSATEGARIGGLVSILFQNRYRKINPETGFSHQKNKEELKAEGLLLDGMVSLKEVSDKDGRLTVYQCGPLGDRTLRAVLLKGNHLQRAYGDQINVMHLDQGCTACGDMYIDDFIFYGRNPMNHPASGRYSRAAENDWTPNRLARSAKISWMESPLLTIPDYLMIGNSFLTSKSAAGHSPNIIDRNSIQTTDGRPYQRRSAFSGLQSWYFVWGASSAYKGRAAHIYAELMLRRVLANDGKYDPTLDKDLLVPEYPRRQLYPYGNNLHRFEVTAIDLEKSAFTARLGGIDYKCKVSLNTRFTLKRDDKSRIAQFADLKIGEKVALDFWANKKHEKRYTVEEGKTLRKSPEIRKLVKQWREEAKAQPKGKRVYHRKPEFWSRYWEHFDMKEYKDSELRLARVQSDVSGFGNATVKGHMIFWGSITAIDKEKRNITVVMPEDGAKTPGYRFWKEALTKGEADPARGATRGAWGIHRLPAAMRWAEGTEQDRTITFHIDDAVRIWHNGLCEQDFPVLKVGDVTTILYENFWETQHKSQGIIYPEMVMGSTPWSKTDKEAEKAKRGKVIE